MSIFGRHVNARESMYLVGSILSQFWPNVKKNLKWYENKDDTQNEILLS